MSNPVPLHTPSAQQYANIVLYNVLVTSTRQGTQGGSPAAVTVLQQRQAQRVVAKNSELTPVGERQAIRFLFDAGTSVRMGDTLTVVAHRRGGVWAPVPQEEQRSYDVQFADEVDGDLPYRQALCYTTGQ